MKFSLHEGLTEKQLFDELNELYTKIRGKFVFKEEDDEKNFKVKNKILAHTLYTYYLDYKNTHLEEQFNLSNQSTDILIALMKYVNFYYLQKFYASEEATQKNEESDRLMMLLMSFYSQDIEQTLTTNNAHKTASTAINTESFKFPMSIDHFIALIFLEEKNSKDEEEKLKWENLLLYHLFHMHFSHFKNKNSKKTSHFSDFAYNIVNGFSMRVIQSLTANDIKKLKEILNLLTSLSEKDSDINHLKILHKKLIRLIKDCQQQPLFWIQKNLINCEVLIVGTISALSTLASVAALSFASNILFPVGIVALGLVMSYAVYKYVKNLNEKGVPQKVCFFENLQYNSEHMFEKPETNISDTMYNTKTPI